MKEITLCGREYFVSADGHIYKGRKQVKEYEDKDGYLYIQLSDNGKRRKFLVHRVIGKVYIPNGNNLPQINHIDGDKKNNSVVNLEWSCSSHNQLHSRYVLHNQTGFHDCPVRCVETGEEYLSTRDAWRKTGINYCHISEATNGKRKSAGGKMWEKIDAALW